MAIILRAILAVAAVIATCNVASAGLVTYTSRPAFNAAAGLLVLEDFEKGHTGIGLGNHCSIDGPLDSTTGGACFDVGDLIPGVQYTSLAYGNPNPSLALVGPDWDGNTSRQLTGPVTWSSFDMLFPQGVSAVGFDVVSHYGEVPMDVTIFDLTGAVLGTYRADGTHTGSNFFGVVSDTANIGHVQLWQGVVDGQPVGYDDEGVDNLAFSAAVPDPGSSLLLFGIALVGLRAARKRLA